MQRETVCDENGAPTAMLVSLGDFENWRVAFLRLRDDRAFAEEMGDRTRALVSRCFTLGRMIDGFENAIMETETQKWVPAGSALGVERVDYTQ
jgi:glycosyltransferase involved in cell wall biosynthesis